MKDDTVTVVAISALAAMVGNVLHEGVGHALVALLTGTPSGVLSTVAWSSAHDTRLVAAGGTIVNLVAGIAFRLGLTAARNASVRLRYFLFCAAAFNLFTGTGYFLFSGVTNFGDWSIVIAGLEPTWAWRTALIVLGVLAYVVAMRVVATGLGVVAASDNIKLTIVPYLTAIVLFCVAGSLNPQGIQLVWQSALPATAGANAGLPWVRYYVPRKERDNRIERSAAWIASAAIAAVIFIFVLGRGVRVSGTLSLAIEHRLLEAESLSRW